MKLDRTTQPTVSEYSHRKSTITINSNFLQTLQWRFALATILVPFIGSIVAIGLLLLGLLPIGLVEIWLLVSLYALTFVGVTVGFHRCFAHKAFEAGSVVKIIFIILGSMAAQGPPINWVATHRRHHQYSDLPGDPHSPYIHEEEKLSWLHGLWHSHLGWMLNSRITNSAHFAKDLLQDSTIVKLNHLYLVWVILGLTIPTIFGGILTWTWLGAAKGFLWGGLVRLFLVHHFFWYIGSIAHIWGTRPLKTSDHSRNNIWLSIPTFGESWHNNHHAFPNSGMFGLKWWQIDLGSYIILALKFAGLVWDVKTPTIEMIEAKKVTQEN